MSDKQPLGVLILHGFTGSLDTVRPVVPVAERLGLPYRMPVLRGHGTTYHDLVGVTQHDWVADAEAALFDLLNEVEHVICVGLSMGGLVSLNLAAKHPKHIDSLVLITPALRFSDPLTPLTPVLKLIFPFWDSPNSFNDMTLAKASTNYPKFATKTFSKLLDFAGETERLLKQVTAPTLVLYSKKDQIVHPIAVKLLEEKLGCREKTIIYFETSGHEMLQDCESEKVVQAIADYLTLRVALTARPLQPEGA